jgi:hypothetical protein
MRAYRSKAVICLSLRVGCFARKEAGWRGTGPRGGDRLGVVCHAEYFFVSSTRQDFVIVVWTAVQSIRTEDFDRPLQHEKRHRRYW